MENWGLIIGSAASYSVVIDEDHPERTDFAQLIQVGSIQSHETSHQWFGNITTMKCTLQQW
jgi:aminopeptidase 2